MSIPMATSIRTILLAVRERLVVKQVLGAPQILFVAQDRVPRFVGKRDLLLWPGRFQPGSQGYDGQGRDARRVIRNLAVIPRVQQSLDQAGRAEEWLLDDDGYFALEERVLDALDMFLPENEDGTMALLVEPMRIWEGAQPVKGHDPKWGKAALQFEIQYFQAYGPIAVPRMMYHETPEGDIDGVNDTFTLTAAPYPEESLFLVCNGILQKEATDFTRVGATITFLSGSIPGEGDWVEATYRYLAEA